MRYRPGVYAVVTVLVLGLLALASTIYFQAGPDSAAVDAPRDHDIVEDAPGAVADDPPSAVGSIDEP